MEKNHSTTSTAQPRSQSGRAPAPAREKADSAPLTATADQAVQSVTALYKQVQDTVETQMERSPYVALGAAAGIGFIVGGGLASPLGQLLLRSSLRTFGPPLLRAVLNSSTDAAEPTKS
jgi:ElaB/YqjD/DUF883 family membrane-anchored ribosome-binding protein